MSTAFSFESHLAKPGENDILYSNLIGSVIDVRKLLRYMKGFGKECVLGPLFKLLEATFELLVPLVVANIVADVIIPLAPVVPRLLKEDGVFLCSGIIDDRADEVKEQLIAAGWQIEETRSSEGWFSYLCR